MLDDDADGTLLNTVTFSGLSPGSYTVEELAAAGFDLTDITCVGGGANTTDTGATATIGLDAGESVTCTYTNTQQGSITIVKDTVPDGPQDFTFNPSANLNSDANFLLDDDADGTLLNTVTFSGLSPGSYTVEELAAAGFDLTDITCVGGGANTTDTGATATIGLDAGESVTCTYTNTQEGSITIVKDTVPDGPQDFTFNPSANLNSDANFLLDDDADGTLLNTVTFSGLSPGSYTVEELAAAGFDLTDITCVGRWREHDGYGSRRRPSGWMRASR